jgi:hypothetical protein
MCSLSGNQKIFKGKTKPLRETAKPEGNPVTLQERKKISGKSFDL